MEVHKPKAVHGWRELANEIGVIVIGVLIALGAEQAVEQFHWNERAAHARDALREEVEDIYYMSAERIIVTPCLNAQLDRLKADVLKPGQRKARPTSIAAVGPMIYRHPVRLWSDTTWQSTISEQVSSHLRDAERQAFRNFYASAATARQMNTDELATGGRLMLLATPLQLDTALRANLIETIEGERLRVNGMNLLARQLMKLADKVFPEARNVLRDQDWLNDMQRPVSTIGWCRAAGLPLAQVPR